MESVDGVQDSSSVCGGSGIGDDGLGGTGDGFSEGVGVVSSGGGRGSDVCGGGVGGVKRSSCGMCGAGAGAGGARKSNNVICLAVWGIAEWGKRVCCACLVSS